ncbi:MAG: CHAD domain-containing protein [Bacteroidales bacterium]|nr:CHAD domain-containing protein [Bacteroidales bacterium]
MLTIEPHKVITRDVKPALAAYIRDALDLLRIEPVPDEGAVHDVRVLMKKCRAAMKLLSLQTDEEIYKREYEVFRETSCVLSTLRDTTVHRKTLKELRKNHPRVFAALQGEEKLAILMKRQLLPEEPSPAVRADLQRIILMLDKAGYRLRFRNMEKLDNKLIFREIEGTYNKVRDRYLTCRNNPKAEYLHEFRKRAKDFLYQLWFFRPANPVHVKSLEKRLDALTQNLGRYNDLAQLIRALEYRYVPGGDNSKMDELVVLIRHAQDRYLARAWPSAYRIFYPSRSLGELIGIK